MNELDQTIFQGIQAFQAAYNRAVNKKLRQIKVLHEIGGSGAERLIRDVKGRFDDDLLVIQKKHGASIRHYVSLIEDETLKKKIRYKVNLCIRHPEKCDTFKTADDFYRWCGADSKFFYEKSLTKKVNKPP